MSKRTAEKADSLLGARGELVTLWPNHDTSAPEYARDFFEAAPHSTVLRYYHPLLLPHPLQTERYAEAVIMAGNPFLSTTEARQLAEDRIQRRDSLLTHPPLIYAIVDQGAIERIKGDPELVHSQLDHFQNTQGRISLQIIPPLPVGQHPGLSGAFTLLSFADSPEVAYLESVGSGTMITDPDDVKSLGVKFGALQAAAYPPQMTEKTLKEILSE